MFFTEDDMMSVKRGAMWLDKQVEGWEELVDLNTLTMKRCDVCVLGQVFGNYSDAFDDDHWIWTEEGNAWAVEHGFMTDYDVRGIGWRRLEAAWRYYLGDDVARS